MGTLATNTASDQSCVLHMYDGFLCDFISEELDADTEQYYE